MIPGPTPSFLRSAHSVCTMGSSTWCDSAAVLGGRLLPQAVSLSVPGTARKRHSSTTTFDFFLYCEQTIGVITVIFNAVVLFLTCSWGVSFFLNVSLLA